MQVFHSSLSFDATVQLISSVGVLPVVVVSTQRVLTSEARHVDVVLNEHDVAHAEASIKTPCSVCHNQSLHAQQEEDPHWIRHLNINTTGFTVCCHNRSHDSLMFFLHISGCSSVLTFTEQSGNDSCSLSPPSHLEMVFSTSHFPTD